MNKIEPQIRKRRKKVWTSNFSSIFSIFFLCARVDDELKREAEDVFEKIGLNISDGINIYLRRVVADKGILFLLTISRHSRSVKKPPGWRLLLEKQFGRR